MTRARTALEQLRLVFWVLPGTVIVATALLGYFLPGLDGDLDLLDGLLLDAGPDTAKSLLEVIVTLTVSVAGISFSVIVIALVLASQQLSPRVLRSFQRNSVNQIVLAMLLGTAVYSLWVLSAVGDEAEEPVPETSVSLAIILATISLWLFAYFLHHVMRSLNASAVIRRIAAEGHNAIQVPFPKAAGNDCPDEAAAERELRTRLSGLTAEDVQAQRAGYLASVEASKLIRIAKTANGFIEQRAVIGDFVVTGATLATLWTPPDRTTDLSSKVDGAFTLKEERIVENDVAFPLRQLADVALKGLSPSLNDPTTAENAMDSVTDTLVRLATHDRGSLLRLDDEMVPRFRAARPEFDDLVRLAFDEVRGDAANRPAFSVRLLQLLAELRDLGGPTARASKELDRQAGLIAEHVSRVADIEADRVLISDALRRLHGRDLSPMEGRGS